MPNLDTITRFGKCPVCGSGNVDADGDAIAGEELKEYQGRWMCTLCIIRLQDSETDQVRNEHEVEEEEFRGVIGLKNSPED